MWHRQLHIFEIPFYYVEYGIAQLGALQLWQHARANLPETRRPLSRRPRPRRLAPAAGAFRASGLAFDFTDKTIAPLMRNVKESLVELAST